MSQEAIRFDVAERNGEMTPPCRTQPLVVVDCHDTGNQISLRMEKFPESLYPGQWKNASMEEHIDAADICIE